jgi:hypothetical protein
MIRPNGYWWFCFAVGVFIRVTTGSWSMLILLAVVSLISLHLGRSVSDWMLERLNRVMRDR